MAKKTGRTRARSVIRQERMTKILEMRKAGLTVRQIAEHFNISYVQVYKDIVDALKQAWEGVEDVAEYLLRIEAERLETLWAKTYKRALEQDFKDMRTVETLLKIHKRKCELFGLDAPKKIAPTEPDGKQSWRPFKDVDEEKLEKFAKALQQAGEIEDADFVEIIDEMKKISGNGKE